MPKEYELLINAILRNYSGLFTDPAFIDERFLSRVTSLSRHRMYEILVSLASKGLVMYAPSKKCPIITFTRHRVLGSELRFSREVYDERRAVFADRLNSILSYATREDKCRSRLLLEYFGEKKSSECGNCDVCVASRAGGKKAPVSAPAEWLLDYLSDRKLHSLDELDAMGLSRKAMTELLRTMCDEEKIEIVDGKIRIR